MRQKVIMWCRFLTFCVCCGEDIENDQVIYENFGNNFLRERLIGAEIVESDNVTLYDAEEVESMLENIKDLLNVHDPKMREVIEKDKADKGTKDFDETYENETTEISVTNGITEEHT
ncbi:uncharacterized protein LOC120624019 [Pararge aegeria]|uniref:uncharacterized protein LOC120624019 n=1 Tax=Pararge aegeria TaxID=116150 RepID=UPI0019CF7D10|nr:uncharacterized protein LOC120624019 [Pararge aegeria]